MSTQTSNGNTNRKRKLNEIVENGEGENSTTPNSKKMKTLNGDSDSHRNHNNINLSGDEQKEYSPNNGNNTEKASPIPPEAAWSSLKVSQETRNAIDRLGFEKMTEIQYKAIPQILEGSDLAGAAKTGSGKTLTFIIPAVELLAKLNWDARSMGTGVLIIAPTRELALQIKEVGDKIVRAHKYMQIGLTIGGTARYAEARLLEAGCAIVVATPGRFQDHLENTSFTIDKLKMLVIDEADHILDVGFEHQMRMILSSLPQERQTLLFSATLTEKTKELVTLAFRNRPAFVKAKGEQAGPTADKLVQMYAIVPQERKLTTLLAWLRQHQEEKILIFLSTKNATRFYEDLFYAIDIPVLALYGGMSQERRTKTFRDFVKAKYGILLATNVASRGLDFPAVHWIIQFDPAEEPKEYIHRVGRTARAGMNGDALVFLQDTELAYLDLLRQCNLEPKKIEIEIEESEHETMQQKIEQIVQNSYKLSDHARQAAKTFVRAYNQRAPNLYSTTEASPAAVARSFGLPDGFKYTTADQRRQARKARGGGERGGGGRGRW